MVIVPTTASRIDVCTKYQSSSSGGHAFKRPASVKENSGWQAALSSISFCVVYIVLLIMETKAEKHGILRAMPLRDAADVHGLISLPYPVKF